MSTQATWGLARRITRSSIDRAPGTLGASARANVGALTAGTVKSAATTGPDPSDGRSSDTHDECRSPLTTSASPGRRASAASSRSRSAG